MNVLEEFDKRQAKKQCLHCKSHVTRQGETQELHFCEKSGKLLLYPMFLPQNCEEFERR